MGVAVSVGIGVSVGSGVDVSVGRGVSVNVGGGRVKVREVTSSCEGEAGLGVVGSVQAVNVRAKASEIFIMFEVMLTSKYKRKKPAP